MSVAPIALFALAALAVPVHAAPEWAVAVFPSGAEFQLEIAADPETRRIGYMGRELIGPGEGMLFIFDTVGTHGMWMKNCKVAIDMVWLDAALRVVHLEPARRPCPPTGECPLIVPSRPARYVLEVAGGTVSREGLSVGDPLIVVAEPPLP